MAAEIFVDTSAWYPIAVEDHPDHGWLSDALTSAIGGGRRVVTTNLIVAETYGLLAARTGPSAALDFVRAVRKPPNEVVSSTPELEDRAITRWLGRHWPGYGHPDWEISFTDAVSFEVISERGIREVLTLKQEGWFFGVAVAGEVGGGQVWRPRGGEPAPHMPGR